MIPSPRRAVTTPAVTTWLDIDDDDSWQDMPVIRSETNAYGLDEEDKKKYRYQAPIQLEGSAGASAATGNATGAHLEIEAETLATDSWRAKINQDESDYTRLRLDEDEESEEVHMRTRYLFDEDKAMTPLSQMQATKELLTEGQRIAYVGLCQLIMRRMLRDMGRGWENYKAKNKLGVKGKSKEVPTVESGHIWMLKIMARLYQHMELSKDEQHMIESLAEHGVDPSDLVPALMTTHTVNNPDFDPKEKERLDLEYAKMKEAEADEEATREAAEKKRQDIDVSNEGSDTDVGITPPLYELSKRSTSAQSTIRNRSQSSLEASTKVTNSLGSEKDNDFPPPPARTQPLSLNSSRIAPPTKTAHHKSVNPFGSDDEVESPLPLCNAKLPRPLSGWPPGSSNSDEEDGDIGAVLPPSSVQTSHSPSGKTSIHSIAESEQPSLQPASTKRQNSAIVEEREQNDVQQLGKETSHESPDSIETPKDETAVLFDATDFQAPVPLPALPGVSTSLSVVDEQVTLDIRWTVLCDLFLVLIADSVFDARSRTFLMQIAASLGFGWLDVIRFENRITEALEIQEGMEKTNQGEIIEGRRKAARNKRYAMMGGGLVIGLSAGLMAPFIGAGLGTAFATIGITGTSGFLAGAGGAAMITTGGVLTGANIAGKGMARRTREVRTFELRPLHNNKRVSCFITVGGFMASKVDDVRLPFSVLDPVVGDVFSVLWEPEMMAEMGGALKILTSEILTQVGQQVLQATIMTALMSALQWPLILTKLGYLIDNPWSNALDRARAAGLLLADVLIQRHAGVRPISLIGFSLGARTIFYCLVELARQKAYGLVQDVIIFGATVTAPQATWLEARSVVSGRFVNCYASNDWMLGYLFRATSGGLNTVAGLRPVMLVNGLENVDVTEIIQGHMSYRSCMPLLLAKVGFPVTAEAFDEPEDPEVDINVQERIIVNETGEEMKKNRKKILGIFPVKSKSGSGQQTPTIEEPPGTSARHTDHAIAGTYELDDEDDLPPREESDLGDIGSARSTVSSTPVKTEAEKETERKAREQEEEERKEAEAIKAIPITAGFDFQAISRELGKEIDISTIQKPEPHHRFPMPVEYRTPLERSGSAPPLSSAVTPSAGDAAWSAAVGSETDPNKSTSSLRLSISGENNDGDIAAVTKVKQMSVSDNLPSWNRSAASEQVATVDITPPASAKGSSKGWSWNAWSSGSNSAAELAAASEPKTPRVAPPARPHPPGLVNAWAFDSTVSGSLGGGLESLPSESQLGTSLSLETEDERKRREEERMAEENPW
nr:hypothetical protein L203_05139 [Cryptococcus depauperatus CBS 7841]